MKTWNIMLGMLLFSGGILAQTTWYEIPTGTNKQLNAIHFPTGQVGYIAGNDSLLLKSTDGGQIWNEISYTGITFIGGEDNIVNLKFVNELVGYVAVGPYTGIYKTTDGGTTWTAVVTSGNLCFNEGLFFFDELNGFFAGSGCFQGELIDKMTAGTIAPATINTATMDAANLVVDIDFYNSMYGLAVSMSGYVLRTTDGGSTWDTIPSGLSPGIPLTSVSIVDDTLAYAGYDDPGGGGFGVLMSTDSGLTWSMDMSSATFYYPAFYSMHTAGNGKVYSGAKPSWATTGLIFENTGPAMWFYYDVEQPVYDMSSYSDSVVFGVGDSGYVVVNVPLGELALNEESNEMNGHVFPNPATEVLNFSPDLVTENSELNITNATGEIVKSERAESNSVVVSDLPAGIYFIQIRSGSRHEVYRFLKL